MTIALEKETTESEAELLARYCDKRSEEAFAELVRRHMNLVFAAAIRQLSGDRQAAEDVTQQVFVELSRQAGKLRKHPCLTGWLYTTSRRMAMDWSRRERRRQRRERSSMERDHTQLSPDLLEMGKRWEELAPVLDEAMFDLRERDRLAILLRHFERKPLSEVGARLGLSDNAARMRVERALEKLREVLKRRGVLIEPAALGTLLASMAAAPASHAMSVPLMAAAASAAGTALAMAAVGSEFGTFGFMSAIKMKFTAGAILVAVAGTHWFLQHQELSRLRTVNRQLSTASRPASDSPALPEIRHEAGEDRTALTDAERQELLKLRGEIGLLKKELRSVSAQRSQPVADANNPVKTHKLFGTELRDQGAATPERALTSLMWAAVSSIPERVSELLELPEDVSELNAPRHYQHFTRQLGEVFNTLEFTSVRSITRTEAGLQRVELNYFDPKRGETFAFPFLLREHGNGWRVVVEGPVPENFQ